MDSKRTCLNCDVVTSQDASFCQHCGQRTDTWRLTFADIFRDLLHSFVNVERGPLAFAWALATRPGRVARDYVQGRRRRHYGPFATLAVIAGIAALVIDVSRIQTLANNGLAPGAMDLLQQHFNLLLLLQLPFIGGACVVMFLDAEMTVPEHLVLVAYALGVQAVVLILELGVAYFDSTRVPAVGYVYAFWVAWYFYFGWAASQFYGPDAAHAWVRGSIGAAMGHAALIGVLLIASKGFDASKLGRPSTARFIVEIPEVVQSRASPSFSCSERPVLCVNEPRHVAV